MPIYQCSNCHGTMTYPMEVCPRCGVLLRGVICGCGYKGAQSEFVRNGNRCPNCNSPVQLVGGVRAPAKPAKPATPFVPGTGWAVFLVVLGLLGPWTLLITFLLGIPLCIIVARKAPKKSTRLVASVGFPLSFVLSLAVVMLLFGNR